MNPPNDATAGAGTLVSIVTPSYQHADFIAGTIQSVRDQDYPYIEHIVVDGGSTDRTLEILQSYEGMPDFRWLSERDGGISDAVNKGVALARGEIIGWLNSDDVYLYADVISRVVARFQREAADVLVGDMAFLDKAGAIIQFYGYRAFTYRGLLDGSYNPGQPSVFIKRDVFCDNKLRTDLRYAMDLDLWLRLGRQSRIRSVREMFAGSRMYPGTNSSLTGYAPEAAVVRRSYGGEPPRWRLRARLQNFHAIKVRGLAHLVRSRYIERRRLTASVSYAPTPFDLASQIFRKMRADYSTYWPVYIRLALRVRRAIARLVRGDASAPGRSRG